MDADRLPRSCFFFFQAEDGIRDGTVTGVQTCALPIFRPQGVDVVGQDGGGVAVGYGPGEPGSSKPDGSDSSSTAKGCGIVLLAIILADLLQAFIQCIGQWANHHTCTFWKNMLLIKLWEQDPPDPRDPT